MTSVHQVPEDCARYRGQCASCKWTTSFFLGQQEEPVVKSNENPLTPDASKSRSRNPKSNQRPSLTGRIPYR